MGFDNVAGMFIMFIAVISMTVIIAGVMQSQVQEVTNSAVVKQKLLASQMREDLSIQHVYYTNSGTKTTIYVRNIGSTQIKPEKLTIYLNDDFFPATSSNVTATVSSETDTINTGVLDKNEILKIEVTHALTVNTLNTVRILSPYGIKYETTFTSST